MSDITHEALEGMGFERRRSMSYIVYEFTRNEGCVLIWYNSAGDIDSVSAGFFGASDVLDHIRTLPQLRRLIRSLFGDDALPRRELSSITDEECRRIVDMAFDNVVEFSHEFFINEDMFLIGHTKHKDSDKLYICTKVSNFIRGEYLETTEKAIAVWSDGVVNGVESAYTVLEIQSYLINELDMHLPAFHGDAKPNPPTQFVQRG